jgi:hypothetical protein
MVHRVRGRRSAGFMARQSTLIYQKLNPSTADGLGFTVAETDSARRGRALIQPGTHYHIMTNYLTLEQFATQLRQLAWQDLSMPWCIRGFYHVTYPTVVQQDSEAVSPTDDWNHIDFSESGRGTVADLRRLIEPHVQHNPTAAVTVDGKPFANVIPSVQPCYHGIKLGETTFNPHAPTPKLSGVVAALNVFSRCSQWNQVNLDTVDQLAESSGLTPADLIFWDGGEWLTRQGLAVTRNHSRAIHLNGLEGTSLRPLEKVSLPHVTVYH